MRIGIHLGFAVADHSLEERVAYVQEAERLGFASLWTGESTGFDAVAPLAWAAGATSSVRLGTSVLQMPARSPAATAMSAIALDRLSGGRLEALGLGVSTPVVAADWHGVGSDRILARTREYVAVVRQVLDGARVSVPGDFYAVPSSGGRALRAQERPAQQRVPVMLAGLGPQMTRLAGQVADGWMPNHVSAAFVREGLTMLPAGFPVYVNLQVGVASTLEAARDLVRPMLGLYFGMGTTIESSPYQQLIRRQGFAEAAAEIWAKCHAGDMAGAQAALPSELLDAVAMCGTPEVVAARLREYADAGVHTIVAFINSVPGVEVREPLRALAAAYSQHTANTR